MQDIVGEVRREGFSIVRGFLSAAEMRQVSQEADRLYHAAVHYGLGAIGLGQQMETVA